MANLKRKKPFQGRRKSCEFCDERMTYVDYKNVDLLKKYVTPTGQIKAKASTGTCAKHQRKVSNAIKRARFVAFMPYSIVRARINK
ncbi:30S ribosomal protein S18 [Mycoplasma sp. NEAQ87857]|uniref:30S ribosomal protein S18 n=1 Tax=Mycoplasma sp. NEAQ87857 TaxID=2683967 RepID=UPI001316CE42|nr:30S ribosomal protein S18 [Mycoplasma sp. NEAQ87857]QGZ97215.1 30S ribosomal protein S18 [Mycoplasma sp. NEAQ87857]